MQDPKALCSELLTSFDSKPICTRIRQALSAHQHQKEEHEKQHEELAGSIKLVVRKNKQLESEAEHIKMQLNKANEICNKRHNERLKLAKKIIELEQKNEELENQIIALQASIAKKEAGVKRASQPSAEALFREVMRGFGVEFIQKAGKLFVRIRNKDKGHVEEIDTAGRDVTEVSEQIWQGLY